MIKYAIILLDRTSVSFCYADNPLMDCQLMPLDTLKEAIIWCMKENLRIQFVYPDYELPSEYLLAINSIDHANIKHIHNADVSVFNGWEELYLNNLDSAPIVLRLSKRELFDNPASLKNLLSYKGHISVVIKDIDSFSKEDFETYKNLLSEITLTIRDFVISDNLPQMNLITDRLFLSSMNNCNAGSETITIAPNGNFYVCPAFYYDDENDTIGSLQNGLNIRNGQLYKLSHAPICRNCDSFHCRRCVWLNNKQTLEVNTPGHEQCVVTHLERNASQGLLNAVRSYGEFLPNIDIQEIDYLDPFDKIIQK